MLRSCRWYEVGPHPNPDTGEKARDYKQCPAAPYPRDSSYKAQGGVTGLKALTFSWKMGDGGWLFELAGPSPVMVGCLCIIVRCYFRFDKIRGKKKCTSKCWSEFRWGMYARISFNSTTDWGTSQDLRIFLCMDPAEISFQQFSSSFSANDETDDYLNIRWGVQAITWLITETIEGYLNPLAFLRCDKSRQLGSCLWWYQNLLASNVNTYQADVGHGGDEVFAVRGAVGHHAMAAEDGSLTRLRQSTLPCRLNKVFGLHFIPLKEDVASQVSCNYC